MESVSRVLLYLELCVVGSFDRELYMTKLDLYRDKLALIVKFLKNSEVRDKICRAIQFGSKFLSGGRPGIAHNVDKQTRLARKVFRLFKFLNDFHSLISPVDKGTPLIIVLLGKSKNAFFSTFLFLDQFVWLGKSGIYKNKERTAYIARISLFCLLGSIVCKIPMEIYELLSFSSKKKMRILALIKSSMDFVVVIGLLSLAPNTVTPRVTGAFGFITSLISCYMLIPRPKVKTS